jgi:hypothetical protein
MKEIYTDSLLWVEFRAEESRKQLGKVGLVNFQHSNVLIAQIRWGY